MFYISYIQFILLTLARCIENDGSLFTRQTYHYICFDPKSNLVDESLLQLEKLNHYHLPDGLDLQETLYEYCAVL